MPQRTDAYLTHTDTQTQALSSPSPAATTQLSDQSMQMHVQLIVSWCFAMLRLMRCGVPSVTLQTLVLTLMHSRPAGLYYFASAAEVVDSSHMTASSSASWSRFSPPSNFVNGHVSTMWFVVCRWPQSQEGDWARPRLCKLARHGPWPVGKRFIRDHVWRGSSKLAVG